MQMDTISSTTATATKGPTATTTTTTTTPKCELQSFSSASASASEQDELITVEKGYTEVIARLSPEEERKIIRKVDWHVVPLLASLMLVSFIDRSNIGNARIQGMEKDLKMTGTQCNIAVSLFFISYGFFEVPSNIIIKMVQPHRWLSFLILAWGIIMTLMGLTNSIRGLYAARFFLGLAEAGFGPGSAFLLSLWYLRSEYLSRLAIWFSSVALSGAVSGLLAYGIASLDGVRGLGGWQCFIIEGLIPISLSGVVLFFLPDSPETAKFLTKKEKEFLINRLALETGSGHGRVTNSEKIKPKLVFAALKDYKAWFGAGIEICTILCMYGFTATTPFIIKELGYTAANAQLMTIPLYVCACISGLAFAFTAERLQQRAIAILIGLSIAIIGFIGQLTIPHDRLPGLTYGFLFPIAIGIYSAKMPILAWVSGSMAPSSKRAVGIAFITGMGQFGGIAGTNMYIESQRPRYPAGYGTGLAACCLGMILTIILRFIFVRENAKKLRYLERESEESIRERHGEQKLLDMGDQSPFFLYGL
ncbi:MFS general substrate transporter [Teratosphaeria nubilosa]|uniref:MFS general substrate transporter n=1 Tax=Teratosphaeria nubilosa TaxID=161662 RepID=A0A6G1LM02_9PEZI|nr:MFS general substrate transporter [Teratosphaeria nubilosa]